MKDKSKYIGHFKYMFKLIAVYWRYCIINIFSVILLTAFSIYNIILIGQLVDESITGGLDKLLKLIFIFLIVIVFKILLTYIKNYTGATIGVYILKDIKDRIGNKLLNSPYSFFSSRNTGDLIFTLNDDVKVLSDFISNSLVNIIAKIILFIGAIVFVSFISFKLMVATYIYIPIGVIISVFINKKMENHYEKNIEVKSKSLSTIEQILMQIPMIKVLIIEGRIKGRMSKISADIYESEKKVSFWYSLIQLAFASVENVPRLAYILFAGHMVLNNEMSIGMFIAILNLLVFIIEPSVYFPFTLNQYTEALASISRIKDIDEVLQYIPTSKEDDGIWYEPEINIENLYFSYADNPQEYILRDFSFKFKGPGIVVIYGKSGSGKSTLLKLICKLLEPRRGRVYLSGKYILSTQNTYIFNDTVTENIRIAKLGARDEEVKVALNSVNLDNNIGRFKDGYNTVLGDGNVNLSGGEKQRIAFARALVSNASIWIMDEPTSSLDIENEQIIIDSIRRSSMDNLLVIATHSELILKMADEVIYTDK